MNLRQLLHIVISYTLLFPSGLLPASMAFAANQEWDSSAVSVGTVNSGTGSELSKPVSVTFPSSGEGTEQSKPVSVTFPSSGAGTEQSKPVSVTMASAAENGTWMSLPAAVSFQTGTMGDPDLVGLWHMDGEWGDASGSNNNLSSSGSTTFSNDKKIGSQSGSFNGSSFAYHSAPSGMNLTDNFTIIGWINPKATQSGGIIDRAVENSGSWELCYLSDGSIQYMHNWNRSQGAESVASAAGSVPLNAWTHFAVVYTGKKATLYINGVAGTPQTFNNNPVFSGSEWLEFGVNRPGADEYFNGLIDEVAVYKRVLTDEEIAFRAKGGAIDPLAPAPPVLNSVASIVGTSSITLSGAKTASTSIWVNNKKVVALDDQTSWQGTYTGLIAGLNVLNVVAADSEYRQSAPASASVIYDNEAPVIDSSSPANNSDSGKSVSSILIAFKDSYSDINTTGSLEGATVKNAAGDTIAGTWFTSGSKSIMFTPTSTLPADTYTVTVYPIDSVENRGQQQITFRNYDLTSPKTTVSLSGTKGVDGWYTTPVTVTLTAEDGQQGAGIDRIEYSFDGLNWNTYTAPFTLSTDGIISLYYRAVDIEGNREENSSLKNVALSTNGGAAHATSVHKHSSYGCEFLASYAIDGLAVQENVTSSNCSSTGMWNGENPAGDSWMVWFSGTKAINKVNWMMWPRSVWSDPQSQPKDYAGVYGGRHSLAEQGKLAACFILGRDEH
jgi:hypothetical protein